jgi:hypothetical protein
VEVQAMATLVEQGFMEFMIMLDMEALQLTELVQTQGLTM